jgi:ABC-type glutathione transport system ATPase component
MVFIAHDLAVVGYVSDRIGVMYRGVLVEEAPARALMRTRHHPYTRYLFDALPVLAAQGDGVSPRASRVSVGGEVEAVPESVFARNADPTVDPVPDPALLEMEEVAPGHRVSRVFQSPHGSVSDAGTYN